METADASNLLLKEKYNLHKSLEAEAAAKRTQGRTGKKVPQDPVSRIQNYLNRFRESVERKDPREKEQGIKAIKQVLLDQFITKLGDISESYWKSQERVLRERGQQGDYNRFSEEEKNKLKKELSGGLLRDQHSSLEQWIDYLASSESSYMPDYMKYWVFRSVTDLQEYDNEKHEFPNRSKGTVKMFPDINHEALKYVINVVVKKHKGEQFTFGKFEYDLTEEAKQKFKKYLSAENFAELYGWANELIQPIPEHLLLVTEGEWVKYDRDTDKTQHYKQLSQSIRGRGTGWCTAGEYTAKTQLKTGDFYVFYSNDDNGNSTIPRIAIRMEGRKIAEIRGIAFKQNLDPHMNNVLATKLEEFPDRKQYFKKETDMKFLTDIEKRVNLNKELTLNELRFLYEIDNKIEGFGQEKDPRVQEIREKRDQKKDCAAIFSCLPEQIALNTEELNGTSRGFSLMDKGIKLETKDIAKLNDIYLVLIGDIDFDKFMWKMIPKNLRHITGSVDFEMSQWRDTGELRTIGKSANFAMSEIQDIGKLESIGGSVIFSRSQIKNLVNLKKIGGYVHIDKKSKLDFSKIIHGRIQRERK